MPTDDATPFDATPTDRIARLRQQAERHAGQHPAGYRPHVEPAPVATAQTVVRGPYGWDPDPDGWLLLYACDRCGALTSYDGADVHDRWHRTRGDAEPL